MQATVVTPMLALYRSDEPAYQPIHATGPLELEAGNPQASLENLKRLKLVIQDIWVRKGLSRALFQFNTGEQYLALGLTPAALAFLASDAGYGEYEDLKEFYTYLPPEYDGKLPAASEPRDALANHRIDLQGSGNVAARSQPSDPPGHDGMDHDGSGHDGLGR
jgi:hypothetical protein